MGASSLAKQNSDIADCNAAEQAVIDKWDTRIAAAQAAWDAAAVVEATEIAEYNRLVGIKNDKQELYDAAVSRQAAEGALARQLHQDDVEGGWEYYTSMHGSITSIATADYAYITEELESLQTVLDIVNQLNLDGNTNGEHVAAEHVTNDYATDAAEAKRAYHGGNIGESNAEGRAGEGALVQEPTADAASSSVSAVDQFVENDGFRNNGFRTSYKTSKLERINAKKAAAKAAEKAAREAREAKAAGRARAEQETGNRGRNTGRRG